MKNFIKNKKGNKILLGLATASVLTVPAIVAVSCADPVKGTIKSVSADVNEKDKKIELTITGENLTKDQKDWKITYQSNAQLKAGEIKEIRVFEIKEVNANKGYTLSFDYSKNPELNKNGVIYTVSHRGGKGVPTSEVYVTPEISKVEATVSADNKNVTLVVTGGMLSDSKEKWTVSKIEPKSKEGETEGTPVDDENIKIEENTTGTQYKLTIENQNLEKDGITYKVRYNYGENDFSEKVSDPIELNPVIKTVSVEMNDVRNVKLTVTGTKLDTKDGSAYTVKRIEDNNGGAGREEAEDNNIENVVIDEASTSTNVILKFNDNGLEVNKAYKYSVQIGESKAETEVKNFNKETKINSVNKEGEVKAGTKEVTLVVAGVDLLIDKSVYKVEVWKVIDDGTGNEQLENVTSEVSNEPSGTEVKIKVTHINALVAGKYKYEVIIDGVKLANNFVIVNVAAE